MRKIIHLNAVTRADRNHLLGGITDAVEMAGGWIEDVNLFSNISIALHFITSAENGTRLATNLESQPMAFDAEDLAKLANLSATDITGNVACTLQITFFHDDPDLRMHIPSVPG